MNPWSIISVAAASVMGLGLMSTTEPEVDTWGLVSSSTVYSPVDFDTPPEALGSPITSVTTVPAWTGPGCSEWAETAMRGGFHWDDLWIALQVMELESMCLPNAIGDNGESFGLMQINSYWCQPSKYWPRGYLQTLGMVNDCADLLDPLTNLNAAWHISVQYGWQNWTTYRRING